MIEDLSLERQKSSREGTAADTNVENFDPN
jgi:hypothetical protein